MSSTAEKANLARIRDNQRRSRARRKEYLQELEARLHQCELQGIEASAEIQQAARRVAEENRKLRVLLRRHGVGEDSVEAFLGSANQDSGVIMGVDIGTGGYGGTQGQAGQILEQLLNTKRHVSADTGAPRRTTVGGSGSRDSSSASLGAQQSRSHWEPSQFSGSHSSTPQQPFLTPTSSVGRTSTSIGSQSQMGNSSVNTSTTLPSQPQGSGVIFDFNQLSSMLQQPTHGQYTGQQQQPQQQQQQPQQQQQQPQHFHPQSQQPQHQTRNQELAKAHANPHNLTPRSHSQNSQYMSCQSQSQSQIPTTGAIGTNSCSYATEMISSLTGSDPNNVRADLGCAPAGWGANDEECEVDNRLVFNVLDRYSGQGGMVGL